MRCHAQQHAFLRLNPGSCEIPLHLQHGTVGGSSWPAQTATVAGAEAGALPVASEVGAAAATAAEEAMAAEVCGRRAVDVDGWLGFGMKCGSIHSVI